MNENNEYTIEDISVNKMYSTNELLKVFSKFDIPSSRPTFFIMKKSGTINKDYFMQYGPKGHLKINGTNLRKLVGEILGIEKPLKGVYKKQMEAKT